MTALLERVLYGPASGARAVLAMLAIAPFVFFALAPRAISIPDLTADPVIGFATPAADSASLQPGDQGTGGGTQACLPRVQRGSAWMDVCWQAYRLLAEQDDSQDYYGLEVTGTAHGSAGSGIRWAVLRARGEMPPSAVAVSGAETAVDLPSGQCTVLELRLFGFPGVQRHVTACENWKTVSDPSEPEFVDSSIWTCGSCATGVEGDRDLAIVAYQGVPQGQLPTWRLQANVGS